MVHEVTLSSNLPLTVMGPTDSATVGQLQLGGGSGETTLEIPDDLYRRAKVKAAMEGRKLKDLVADGLLLVIESAQAPWRPANLPPPTR